MHRLFLYIKILFQISLVKTLYFNFKVFPLPIAIKTPVHFFGSLKFASLKGKVKIMTSNLIPGMIVFGGMAENIMGTKYPLSYSLQVT
jgi:hypothetical protein